MSDTGPENLTLRYLRSMDERLARLEATVTRGFDVVAARLTGIEGRFIAVEGRLAALEEWSADTSRRLDRIERRLDLVEPAESDR
jgi:hypothetical protein